MQFFQCLVLCNRTNITDRCEYKLLLLSMYWQQKVLDKVTNKLLVVSKPNRVKNIQLWVE